MSNRMESAKVKFHTGSTETRNYFTKFLKKEASLDGPAMVHDGKAAPKRGRRRPEVRCGAKTGNNVT